MLNRIVLNRIDYLHKNGFGVKLPKNVDMPKNPTNQTKHQLLIYRMTISSVADRQYTKRDGEVKIIILREHSLLRTL